MLHKKNNLKLDLTYSYKITLMIIVVMKNISRHYLFYKILKCLTLVRNFCLETYP